MKITEARFLVKLWQKRLGLSDWKVHVRFGTQAVEPNYNNFEMHLDTIGEIVWSTEDSEALMLLNRKLVDEHTIIHELLHLRLEGHKPINGKYDQMYERALNEISRALNGKA